MVSAWLATCRAVASAHRGHVPKGICGEEERAPWRAHRGHVSMGIALGAEHEGLRTDA